MNKDRLSHGSIKVDQRLAGAKRSKNSVMKSCFYAPQSNKKKTFVAKKMSCTRSMCTSRVKANIACRMVPELAAVATDGEGTWTLTCKTIENKLKRLESTTQRLRDHEQSPRLHDNPQQVVPSHADATQLVMAEATEETNRYQAENQRLLDKIDNLEEEIRKETSDHSIKFGELAIRQSRLKTEIRELLALKLSAQQS